jgi:hypothetical protein
LPTIDLSELVNGHWAERFFSALEWFALLVISKEITDERLIGFYQPLIKDAYEKILPVYYTEQEREDECFVPEFQTL